MWSPIKTGLFSIILGTSSMLSANTPCWSFGYASEGDYCRLMDEDMPNKVLLGKVIFPKDKTKPVKCVYQNPIKEKSSSGTDYAFLLGDFEGLQRTIPGKDPIPASQFVNMFPYCHPNSSEAKEHPMAELLKLTGPEDLVCILEQQSETPDGIEFGFWDSEKNQCESVGVAYTKSEASNKKNELYRQVCLYELLDQDRGWATDGPKGHKSHYGTTGKNWHQGMHECKKQQLSKKEEMPYCSWDQGGDYYYGSSQDPADNGDGQNAIMRYRCLYELIEE